MIKHLILEYNYQYENRGESHVVGTVELGAPGVHHGVLIRQVQSQALPVSGQKPA